MAQGRAEDPGGFYHDALPGNGITAFESGHRGESSEDDGGESSPILNNTSFTSDQNEEPPLSDRSPSNIETETEPIVVEGGFDWYDMNRTFLPLAFDEFLAVSAIRFTAGGSEPENAKILLSFAVLCSFSATILCCGGYMFERRKAKVARLMTGAGVFAVVCTLVFVLGSLFVSFK